MKLIWQFTRKYKKLLLLDFVSVFGFALAELGIPTLIAQMIDQGINRDDPSVLYRFFGIVVLISVVAVSLKNLLAYCSTRISTNVTYDIREAVFNHTMRFSHAEMEKFGVASMITRTNNDAYQIMVFLQTILRSAMLAPVMIVVSLLLVTMTSLPLATIVFATIPVIVVGVVLFAKFSAPLSENQQKSLDAMNRILRENLSGIRVIRSFNNEPFEQKRFAKENEWYTSQTTRLFKMMSCTDPLFFFMMNLATIAIYYLSSLMLGRGAIEIGQVVAFIEYLFHAMMSVLVFCMVFMMYPRANVSAKRIEAVLETKSTIVSGAQRIGRIEDIRLEHVSFSYPNGEENVLTDISFEVKKGEKLAVIGSTGSGKSTLVKLLARFYDPTKGRILVNGKNIRDLDLSSLRSEMGFVSQKPHMFKGSIHDNIAFGLEQASFESVHEAATIAQAADFILERDEQYEEEIAEEGTNLSGGQKQRISIARALLKKSGLYIYDDSFSALDFKTDAKLRAALEPMRPDSIFIVVAQRVSTILDADKILVLDEGRIVGYGSHPDLYDSCAVYREIVLSQLSEKEVRAYAEKTDL
ncbi:ABC transporter ATP-binding protein [uncultured Dubosiella sp.]|uniref:ABC transporter ATP-binding protein n=1 Tax=uncultured Dubosiella sp. TaxID=1937011 RepID=UPI00259B10CB|nr:ABC transporter ATP-binding protein [uncultured Dubosiella sp.]